MSNFTKIIACLNPQQMSPAVLDAAFNIASVFGSEVAVMGTQETINKHESLINQKTSKSAIKVHKIPLNSYNEQLITKQANLWGSDLIVKNADKYSQKVINAVEHPVLTILDKFEDKPIKNIVIPLHDDPGTRQKIPVATSIAKHFGATVHIIGVTSSDKEEQIKIKAYIHQAEKFLAENNVNSSSYLAVGKKVDVETVDYAQKINAEMVIIMNERDAGWFTKPLSEKIILNSKVPVMVVEPKSTTVSWAQL